MVFFWLCELPFLRISTESSGSGIPSFTALNLIVVFDSRSWSAIAIREGGQKAKLQGKWRREDLDVLRNDSRRFAIVEGKRINFHDFNVRLGKCLAKVTTAFVVPAPRNRIMEYIYIYFANSGCSNCSKFPLNCLSSGEPVQYLQCAVSFRSADCCSRWEMDYVEEEGSGGRKESWPMLFVPFDSIEYSTMAPNSWSNEISSKHQNTDWMI